MENELMKNIFKNIYQYPTGIYLPQVSNRNTRARCEICLKLTIKTPKQRHWRCSGVFIVNFEHILRLANKTRSI